MENGDQIFLTDSNGTTYAYRVLLKTIAEPIPGKRIVTLQTCTLPDYVQRLIVQAELTKVS
jgi:sortase A